MSTFCQFLALTLLVPLMALPAALGQVSYLESETFAMPTNGTEVASMKPLDPAAHYRVWISSSFWLHNLAPLELIRFRVQNGVATITTDFSDPQVELWSGIIMNGKLTRTRNHAKAQYSDTKNLTELEFELAGTDRPLTLRTVKAFFGPYSTINVRIDRLKPQPPPPPPAQKPTTNAEISHNQPNTAEIGPPYLLVPGLLACALVIWRVVIYTRRRQLRMTLRRLMTDIERVEKARKTVHHHLDN